MEADALSHTVWAQIYQAIEKEKGTSPIIQGVVSDRDEAKRVIWVRELSSDPIRVVGQNQDLTFFSGQTRKVTKTLPAIPQIGDVVLLIRTVSDAFYCVGVVVPAAAWTSPGAVGLVGPASIMGSKINFSAGLTPPSNPMTNDLWLLTGAGPNGEEWLFRYNSSETGSYKWKFVGGPSFFSEITTNEQSTSGTYAALATAGPSIALPRPGDYRVAHGFMANNNVAGSVGMMSYDIGGTGASDLDFVISYMATSQNWQGNIGRERLKTGLTAVTLTAKYKISGTSAYFGHRWMRVTPIRVS